MRGGGGYTNVSHGEAGSGCADADGSLARHTARVVVTDLSACASLPRTAGGERPIVPLGGVVVTDDGGAPGCGTALRAPRRTRCNRIRGTRGMVEASGRRGARRAA